MLSSEAATLINKINELNPIPLSELSIDKVRSIAEKFCEAREGKKEEISISYDEFITSCSDEHKIKVHFYCPQQKNKKVILFCHGGGWVRGSLRSYDHFCRRLANRTDCVVLSVDYRLSPEYKYPIALNDVENVYKWLIKNCEKFGFEQIIFSGDSAGANLVSSLIIRLIKQQYKLPDAQVLFYPVTDLSMSHASYSEFENGFLLSKADMKYYISSYVNEFNDIYDPLLSPLYYKKLNKFPKTIIIAAECDPLRDEGKLFAEKLNQGLYKSFKGVLHGFVNYYSIFPEAEFALQFAASELKKLIKNEENFRKKA